MKDRSSKEAKEISAIKYFDGVHTSGQHCCDHKYEIWTLRQINIAYLICCRNGNSIMPVYEFSVRASCIASLEEERKNIT